MPLPPRPDRAGHVGAVVVARPVVDGGVVGVEVPAVDVVDVAVPVVVDAVGGLAGVRPDVGRQVWVADLDALVDDAHVDVRVAGVAGVPGLAGPAPERVGGRRAVAVHAPVPAPGVVGVVRDGRRVELVVRLDVGHAGTGPDLRDGLLDGLARRQLDDDGVPRQRRRALRTARLDGRHRGATLERPGARLEADDDVAPGVGCATGRRRRERCPRRSRSARRPSGCGAGRRPPGPGPRWPPRASSP